MSDTTPDHITLVLTAAAMVLAEEQDEKEPSSHRVLRSPATYHASNISITLHIRGQGEVGLPAS